MFKKVLIVEDHESTNIAVQRTLDALGISLPPSQFVYHCDDAVRSIRRAIDESDPFELLITDLYFEEDDREQTLKDGKALIAAAREIQSAIKVLVFSAEHRPVLINNMFTDLSINGYVRKARRDATELKAALEKIFLNRIHKPDFLRQVTEVTNAHNFTKVDLEILRLILEGKLQKEMPEHLEKKGLKALGISSIEKRISLMKSAYGFTHTDQLVAMCKTLGMI